MNFMVDFCAKGKHRLMKEGLTGAGTKEKSNNKNISFPCCNQTSVEE